MAIDQESIIKQIDVVFERYQEARRQSQYDDLSDLPESQQSEMLTLLAAAVERLAPEGSRYRKNAHAALEAYGEHNSYNIQLLLGVLKALRSDYLAGYLQELHELIHADIFSDFLEMAEYLLNEGYKDASAVIIGGVLEEHLRKLCLKNNISITVKNKFKKAESMNTGLASSDTYSRLDQKSVTSWLDLRNKSAHGRYAEYTDEQVNLMLQGVRDFITRHPA